MVRVRVVQHLEAPVDRVWSVLADFGAIADWVDDLADSKLVHGDRLRVGTERVCTYVTPVAGQPSIREVVTAVDEDARVFEYDIPEGLAAYKRGWSRWHVEPDGAGCFVHFETALLDGGLLGWLFAGQARKGIRDGIRRALEGLEVEANRKAA